jgi:hypothetical protein
MQPPQWKKQKTKQEQNAFDIMYSKQCYIYNNVKHIVDIQEQKKAIKKLEEKEQKSKERLQKLREKQSKTLEELSLPNEIWKTVVFHDVEWKDYKVSNMGRFQYKKEFPTFGVLSNDYKRVKFNDKMINIHILICETFNGRPLLETQNIVDHINQNKLDNRPENLRFVNSQHNNQNKLQGSTGHLFIHINSGKIPHFLIEYKGENYGYYTNIQDALKMKKILIDNDIIVEYEC